MSWWELLWCIGGVFYVKNQARQSVVILEFSKFIFDQGLMDILLVGGNFTWSNNRELQLWSRIDGFLLCLEWE